jgi:hypothetical protein
MNTGSKKLQREVGSTFCGAQDDAVFRAVAKVPAEWMGVGIVRQGPPFDVNEFLRLCGEETEV